MERTCIGCRRKAAPAHLVRVVRREDGRLEVGRTLPGRGAWLCAGSPACVETALRRRAFDRALRGPVDPRSVEGLRIEAAERARVEGWPPIGAAGRDE
jgi:predicted RNA-binding protein YlxR (DUF448 family)